MVRARTGKHKFCWNVVVVDDCDRWQQQQCNWIRLRRQIRCVAGARNRQQHRSSAKKQLTDTYIATHGESDERERECMWDDVLLKRFRLNGMRAVCVCTFLRRTDTEYIGYSSTFVRIQSVCVCCACSCMFHNDDFELQFYELKPKHHCIPAYIYLHMNRWEIQQRNRTKEKRKKNTQINIYKYIHASTHTFTQTCTHIVNGVSQQYIGFTVSMDTAWLHLYVAILLRYWAIRLNQNKWALVFGAHYLRSPPIVW